jgi:thiamine-phosphate diphosphorylase
VTPLALPAVCLVTDRHRLAPGAGVAESVRALERLLAEAIDAGVDLIQIRERDLDARALCELTRRVMRRASSTLTKVVVNDRADVALAANADGVHLRGDSADTARVRALRAGWLVGRSVHSGEPRVGQPAEDYLLFGTMFPTASKPGAATADLAALGAVAVATPVPVLAIGGVTPDNAGACCRAGAAGVAAIGAFLPADLAPAAWGAAAAVRAFRDAMKDAAKVAPRSHG